MAKFNSFPIPNAAVKNLVKSPILRIPRKEKHQISCPYCRTGYAIIDVEILTIGDRKEVKVNGMDEPHTCIICEKKFKLAMKVVGVPISNPTV